METTNENRIYKVPSTTTNEDIASILSVLETITVEGGVFRDSMNIIIAAKQDDEHISIHEAMCDEEVIVTARAQFNRLSDEENREYLDHQNKI